MSGARFFVLGATHHAAPIEVRERLALSAANEASLQSRLAAEIGLRELAVLNTCNRVEFYGVSDDPAAPALIEAAFCAQQQFSPDEFSRLRLQLRDRDAIMHLFEVAAGLDSQMLGETEIFGQVKDAYAAAQDRQSAGPILHRIFQKAFQAAKHVRANTAITTGQVSVANVAVDLAQNIFGALKEARVLLLGAGEIAEKTARAFRSREVAMLTVASRRLERAMELATALGSSALPFDQHESRLSEFDIVVCATAAPSPIVSQAAVAAALRKRPARPFLFLDLALPRDVEPAAASLQNVFLYNLDDLAKIAEENRRLRETELVRCRSLLSERAAALWNDLEARLKAGGEANLRRYARS